MRCALTPPARLAVTLLAMALAMPAAAQEEQPLQTAEEALTRAAAEFADGRFEAARSLLQQIEAAAQDGFHGREVVRVVLDQQDMPGLGAVESPGAGLRLHARFGLGAEVLKPYKATIERWIAPDVYRNQDTSVSKAKKAISASSR